MFVGSDNKYLLYVVNRFYNADAFGCVVKLRKPDDGKNHAVIGNWHEKETVNYRCVLPE